MRYYTGVGSRETPDIVQCQMQQIAKALEKQGYVLRSGAADGADLAFESGVTNELANLEIYLPWNGFNNHRNYGTKSECCFPLGVLPRGLVLEAEKIAKEIHPAWDRLSQGAQKLHTRNIFQVLGKDLNTPSEFLICYAQPQGNSVKGGTRTAVEVAKKYEIPVINLYHEDFR